MGRKKLPPEQRKENAPKIAFRCTKTEQLAVGRKAAERNMKIDEIVRDAWELYDLIPRARIIQRIQVSFGGKKAAILAATDEGTVFVVEDGGAGMGVPTPMPPAEAKEKGGLKPLPGDQRQSRGILNKRKDLLGE